METVDRTLEMRPDFSYVYLQKGIYLARQGKHADALGVLRAGENVELQRAVPSGVKLRGIREEIAKTEAFLEG